MNCKNCNNSTSENFCSFCGQSTKVTRLNYKGIVAEATESILQMNRGFLFSLKQMTLRPGHTIREYIEGKRKPHFKPIAYAFTLSTLYFLLSKYLGSNTIINDFMGGFAEAGAPDKAQQSTINVISENYAITMLLLIPVSAFSSYLAFKGTGYNYLEHFILIAFITGHQAILYSLVAIIGTAIDPDLAATISLFVSISFAYYVYWQFFEGTNRRTLIIPFLGSYLLFLILSAVVGTPLLMLALNYW